MSEKILIVSPMLNMNLCLKNIFLMAYLFSPMTLPKVSMFNKYVVAYPPITSSTIGITVLKNTLSGNDEQCKLKNDCRNLMLRLFPQTYHCHPGGTGMAQRKQREAMACLEDHSAILNSSALSSHLVLLTSPLLSQEDPPLSPAPSAFGPGA